MKVRAKHDGFYRGVRQRAGSIFDFLGEKPGKWMEPVGGAKPVDKEKPK